MRKLIAVFALILFSISCTQQEFRKNVVPDYNGLILTDEDERPYLIYLSDSTAYNVAPGQLDTITMTFSFPIYE
jgi:hypothetical protein